MPRSRIPAIASATADGAIACCGQGAAKVQRELVQAKDRPLNHLAIHQSVEEIMPRRVRAMKPTTKRGVDDDWPGIVRAGEGACAGRAANGSRGAWVEREIWP